MSGKRQKKKRGGSTYSGLDQHRQVGKVLQPPILQKLENLEFTSWMNDSLPEVLWAALIVGHLNRDAALQVFRRAVAKAKASGSGAAGADIRHSALANIDPALFADFFSSLAEDQAARHYLRALRVLPTLPGRSLWDSLVGFDEMSEPEAWDALRSAVLKTLSHRSQESTDCMWLMVVSRAINGQLFFPKHLPEIAEEIRLYPDHGDPGAVAATVRAMAGGLRGLNPPDPAWSTSFWGLCLASTPCESFPGTTVQPLPALGTSATQVRAVYDELREHFLGTQTTTALDARHDSAFGLALASVAVLAELLRVGNSTASIGRAALRSLTECAITLKYLAKNDEQRLWQMYRQYGQGQAKLAFLKLDQLGAVSDFVDQGTLEALANEDRWQELVPINLGHWADLNARKMAEEANCKDLYDQYYDWTSGYVHGHWAAVRDSVFEICGNPLHRLHRIPRSAPRALGDVVGDACRVVDHILTTLSQLYPGLKGTVTLEAQ